jgi:hypothetical protein
MHVCFVCVAGLWMRTGQAILSFILCSKSEPIRPV